MPRIEFDNFVGKARPHASARGTRIVRASEAVPAAEIEAAVRRLPALPALLHELMKELRDDNADIGRLEERIASDPSLTTRVLKMANSPFYVRASEVVDVKRAVLTLGFRTVANLVMAAGLRNTIARSEHVPGFVANGIFLHSLAAGLAASRLARGVGALREDAKHLFVAGLLHDIGRVALTEFYLQRREELDLPKRRALRPETESEVLGIDHQRAGKLVHERWNLPIELAAPITAHHEPIDTIADQPLTLAVTIVDLHLNQQGYARTEKFEEKARLLAACEALGVDADGLDARLGDVGEEVSSIAGSFA